MKRRPTGQPIGLALSTAAREVERAFDAALETVGGSRPTWLILMTLKQGPVRNQRDLAATLGIEGATLTHHLNAMEGDGLVTRQRDPENRRVHVVALTGKGEAAFQRMLGTVQRFDQRLRSGIDAEQLATVQAVLRRLRANVASDHLVVSAVVPGGGDE